MPLQINQFPKHFLSTTYLPGLIEIKLGDLWGAYGDLVIPLFPYYISFVRTSSISPLNWAEMLVSTFLMTFPNGYILHLGHGTMKSTRPWFIKTRMTPYCHVQEII